MEPRSRFPAAACRRVRFVLTDVDDTQTHRGRLAARTYGALGRLHAAGRTVVAATAAPAGWCDPMARVWPIDGVIGENGGFYFRRQPQGSAVLRRFWLPEDELVTNMGRLMELAASVRAEVPGRRSHRTSLTDRRAWRSNVRRTIPGRAAPPSGSSPCCARPAPGPPSTRWGASGGSAASTSW